MNNIFFKKSMSYGLLIGLLVIVYYLIIYFAGIDLYKPKGETNYFGKIDYLIIAIGVFLSIKRYRDNELDGIITYKNSLFFGTATGFFASIIITLYIIIFFKFIDPSMFHDIYSLAEKQLLIQSNSEAEADELLKMAKKMIFPVIIFATIMGNTFIAFLYSVFVSFFMRRKK